MNASTETDLKVEVPKKNGEAKPQLISFSRSLTIYLSILSLLFPLISAVGWIFNIPLLTQGGLPALPSMQPNTVLCLALGAIAILLSRKEGAFSKHPLIASSFALIIMFFGLMTLSEYMFGIDLGIDRIFIGNGATAGHPFVGRPSPQTSVNFVLLAASLLSFNLRFVPSYVGQITAILMGANALVAMTGYIFSSAQFYGFPMYDTAIGMAIHTAIDFILLTAALLFNRPLEGVMTLVTSDTRTGSMARRILLASLLIPPAIGAITKIGVLAGWYDITIQISLFAVAIVVLILRTTWKAAKLSEQEELRTKAALEETSRANERLKKLNEERLIFAALIENSSDFIGLADADGKPIYLNPAGRNMVGLSADYPVQNTQITEYYPPDQHAFVTDVILKTMFEQGRWQGETFLRHWQTQKVIPVSDTHFIIREPETKRILGHSTITRNISDIKKAQEKIQQSEERYELALRGANLGSWDWNIKTDQVIFNQRWAEMRGFALEEIKPHVDSWSYGIHPDDLPRVQKTLNDYFNGMTTEYEAEFRTLTKSGKWIWILARGKVFTRDENGKPIRMVGMDLDITERKRLENEQKFLADVGSVLASILDYEYTIENIAQLAVRDIADLCIVYVVEETGEVRHLKSTTPDPSKNWVNDLLMRIPFDRKRPNLINSVLETKKSLLIEALTPEMIASLSQNEEHLRALRSFDPKSIIVAPLLVWGKLLGAISFISSAPSRVYGPSDLRMAEELALRAAFAIENSRLYREAQQAIKIREEVLAIVSHDLKNPLMAIKLAAQLIQQLDRPDLKKQHDYAKHIQRSVEQMQRLVNDLLDFARIESGTFSIEKFREKVIDVISPVTEGVKTLIEAKRQNLEVHISPTLPDVACDAFRMGQVLSNLLGNAIKFTPEGGTLKIIAIETKDEILISVSDTGPGIPPEQLPKVFDSFWQAEATKRLGSGLGLSIAKGIVAAHGAKIWVESQVGKGTQFTFTIPLATADTKSREPTQQSAEKPADPESHLFDGIRILLVDDSPEILYLMKHILENAGAKITEAQSMAEALLKISQEKPNIMIADIEMPNGSGYDLIEKIHQIERQEKIHIPVAALTAHTNKKEIKKIEDAGFDARLSKPITASKLISSIRQMVDRNHLH